MRKLAKLLLVSLIAVMALATTGLAAPTPDAPQADIVSESYVGGFGNMTDKFVVTADIDLSAVTAEDIVLEGALVHPYIGLESQGVTAVSYADGKLTIDVDDFCVYRSPDMKLTINDKAGNPLLTFTIDNLTYHNPDIDRFAEGTTTGALGIKYRLYSPAETGALPIIVHLHGNGQQGDDNLLPLLADNAGVGLATEVAQGSHPFYALVPQCPADSRWTKEAVGEVLDVVNALVAEGKVDPSRIYLTGHSMGAFGGFQAIADYPGTFAAAVLFAGGCDYTAETAKTVADSGIAVWIVHAADDFIVNPESSRSAYQILKDAGANVYYTELDASLNYNHGSNLLLAEGYTPADGHDDLYTWMFKQTRSQKPEPAGSQYVVVKGDSLWSIAARHLGSGTLWRTIYQANADTIKNPNLIYVGQTLIIPAP